jgi:beta-galactosidase GanA
MGINALRTYFTWYWVKEPDLTYLQSITQNSPMTVFKETLYPYTVFFDHTPFLDACYKAGIYVVLGIALEGGNCFNFTTPDVLSAYQNFYLQTAQKLATLYGRHPAVMGFCMGNEQNNAGINTDSRVYVYYQKMYNAISLSPPPPTSWSRSHFKTTKLCTTAPLR